MLEERFYSLGRHLKNMFDERVLRISVQLTPVDPPLEKGISLCAGGTLVAPHEETSLLSIREQVNNAKERMRQRFKFGKFLVHLHSSPGVFASIENISAVVEKILADNEVIGLSITIRPDSCTREMVSFLQKTSKYICTWVELGLHTVHDETLRRLDISHTFAETKDAVARLLTTKMRIVPHIVFGLPGETPDMMRKTMVEVSRMNFDGVNIHNMYVLKGSHWEAEYAAGRLNILTRDEYKNLVCDFIEILPASTVLYGIVDAVPEDRLIAPDWMQLRKENLDLISAELERRGAVQGCRINELILVAQPASNE